MNQTRYIYRTVPLSEARAKEIRAEEIKTELGEIEYRKQQIADCEKQLLALRDAPLDTTREEQISLNPGNPGYDEAPPIFSPTQYQGDVTGLNSQPLPPGINEIRKLESGDFAIGNMIPASSVVQNQLREFYERTLLGGATGGFLFPLTPDKGNEH